MKEEGCNFSYKGLHNYLLPSVMRSFKMTLGNKYRVSITESRFGKFRFETCNLLPHNYIMFKGKIRLPSFICKDVFHEIFFTPDETKRYNITVKKVTK
jgi:hypothetical protein